MVEAVVVLPVLITFLGLMVWTSHSYNEKLREQTATRATVLSFGSNACRNKNVPSYPERPRESVTDASQPRISDPTAEPGDADGSLLKQVVKRFGGFLKGITGQQWGMAEAHAEGNVVGATSIDSQRVPLSRKVHGDSYVGCNEIAYDGALRGLAGVVGGLSASGGGLF
jgi:hypothetical protein